MDIKFVWNRWTWSLRKDKIIKSEVLIFISKYLFIKNNVQMIIFKNDQINIQDWSHSDKERRSMAECQANLNKTDLSVIIIIIIIIIIVIITISWDTLNFSRTSCSSKRVHVSIIEEKERPKAACNRKTCKTVFVSGLVYMCGRVKIRPNTAPNIERQKKNRCAVQVVK